MTDDSLVTLTMVAALGCGLAGGVFFAFSAFVMDGLGRLPSPQGAAAMSAINVAAPTPGFMALLFGTAAACLALAVSAVARWGEPATVHHLVAASLYLVGVVMLTIAYHLPRNDALAAVDPNGAGGAEHWARYLRSWTAWNHVRTATSLGAAASLVLSLRVP